jgi:hypothetical protein
MTDLANRELTAEDKNKLDRLQAILAMFAEINKIIDIPMMGVMALVCRHEGEREHQGTHSANAWVPPVRRVSAYLGFRGGHRRRAVPGAWPHGATRR